MARIRTIKPEFWTDEKMAPLPPIDRLVFLGLIGMADDMGRLLDNVKIIDAFVFSQTDDTVRESLANLSRIGRIERGKTASGQAVIQIVNWTAHQKVDHPNARASLPQIVEKSPLPEIRESLAKDSREPREPLATLPTTNDQRPTTTDPSRRRKSAAEVPGWVVEAVELWTAAIGVVSHGRLGKALKPAVDRWGWFDGNPKGSHVRRWLEVYLDARPYTKRNGAIWGDDPGDNDSNAPARDTRFCSPEDFARNIQTWRQRCEPIRGAA